MGLMNSKYHTNRERSQSAASVRPVRRTLCFRRAMLHSPQLLRTAVPVLPAHPVLVGDRARLRELRAAEMAAWEAAFPETDTNERSASERSEAASEPRQRSTPRLKLMMLFLLLSAAGGTVAVSMDLQDFSLLVTAWTQLVGGLRNLFA